MLHNEPFQKLEFEENWEKDSNLPEPLLIPNSRRFVLFPIQYSNVAIFFLTLVLDLVRL